jgi:isoquinoline 1-oxidoreductase beta subunit
MRPLKVDRRQLLGGGAAAAGLTIAFLAWPRRPGSTLLSVREGEQVFGAFLRIGRDGRVTVAVPQAETGQGSWTGLAQIAADELGADWTMVAVEPAPLGDDAYANPLSEAIAGRSLRLTAGSSSIRGFEAPLRRAAAGAREMLCAAAAARWKVAASDCDAVGGAVVHAGRRAGFGELVDDAAALAVPRKSTLRAAGGGALAGRPLGRLDLAAKSDGSWRFAGDVRLGGMRFASVRIAPPGGRLTGFDRVAAARSDIMLVERSGWLAAIGPSWWAAEAALRRAQCQFTGAANADTPGIEASLAAALATGDAHPIAGHGDYSAATSGRRPLAATYFAAPAPHLSLELPAAVARFTAGRLELWAASLAPQRAREAAARAAGIAEELVSFYPMNPGDNEGAALATDAIEIAVVLAREAKRAVALTIPAATAHNHDRVRAPMLARVSALANPAGGLDSWRVRVAGSPGLEAVLGEDGEWRPRGFVPPYAVGALKVDAVSPSRPLRPGYLRGGDEALGAFVTETFIDELARARGVEPLAFRIGLLGGRPRLANVLTRAATLGQWDGGGRGSSLGISCAAAFGSFIALVAEARIGADQRVAVTRLVAAVDCGRIVNPNLVRQQIEGGLLAALTSAIGPAPEIIAGMPRARPLAAMGLGRLSQVPKVEVELIRNATSPGGVSGLGACVAAAAVGNAVFAATGLRLRRLPFDPMSPA